MSKLLKEMERKRERGIHNLNTFDPLAQIRNGLRVMARERDDYSGCPLPLDGQRLVIEPTFKYAGIGEIGKEEEPEDGAKVRNVFWSHAKHCLIAICEEADGKIWHAPLIGSANSATALLLTLGASDAWGIEQESKALELLAGMLRHRQMKQYLMTGSFIETSARSGVKYIFRKLRPTVALAAHSEQLKILCTLCMHPIGYYESSWAGCMCPTDDVVAHLALMRGDEKMFWRRCNQHQPWEPQSGL